METTRRAQTEITNLHTELLASRMGQWNTRLRAILAFAAEGSTPDELSQLATYIMAVDPTAATEAPALSACD